MERECADVSGGERGAKMTASCCLPNAELRWRCSQGQLPRVPVQGPDVCQHLLVVTYLVQCLHGRVKVITPSLRYFKEETSLVLQTTQKLVY